MVDFVLSMGSPSLFKSREMFRTQLPSTTAKYITPYLFRLFLMHGVASFLFLQIMLVLLMKLCSMQCPVLVGFSDTKLCLLASRLLPMTHTNA